MGVAELRTWQPPLPCNLGGFSTSYMGFTLLLYWLVLSMAKNHLQPHQQQHCSSREVSSGNANFDIYIRSA